MGIKNAAAWRRLPMPRLILDTAKIGNYLTRQGGCAKFPWIFFTQKSPPFPWCHEDDGTLGAPQARAAAFVLINGTQRPWAYCIVSAARRMRSARSTSAPFNW